MVTLNSLKRLSTPKPRTKKRSRAAYYLIIPTSVLLSVVIVYPIISAIVMSFQKDAALDPETGIFTEGGFAGFQNYAAWIFQQCATATGTTACAPGTLGAQFWDSVGVTFFFAIVTVLLETALGLWMAVIMSRSFRGRGLVRAAVLVPWAIPTAVTAKLWFFIFSFGGIANSLLNSSILWTGSEGPARFAIILIDVWKTTPFMALLILAGLQMIPGEVHEAAKVDGASPWQRFWHITLPLVKPALMVAVLFRLLDALRMYDLPAILTGGANGTTTLSVLVVEQLRQGFNSAAALSTLTFLVIFAVAFVFVRFLGAQAFQGSGAVKKAKK